MGNQTSVDSLFLRGDSISPDSCRSALENAGNIVDFYNALKGKEVTPALMKPYSIHACTLESTYKMGKQLGHGQYGKVYRAVRLEDKKEFVVKSQRNCVAFGREVAYLHKLDGTEVAPRLADAYVCEGNTTEPFSIVMEKLDFSLWEYLVQNVTTDAYGMHRIPMAKAVIIVRRCLKIKEVLRERKMSFRDWHMHNLMYGGEDWKLIDFGAATKYDQKSLKEDMGSFSDVIVFPLLYLANVGMTQIEWDNISGIYGDKTKENVAHVNVTQYALLGSRMETWFVSKFGIPNRPTLEDPDFIFRKMVEKCEKNNCQGGTSRL
jgi:serine/threonine protein kinase